ncbi:HD-GYP domain-containing protein [Alkalicoccus daliensis]|uniref:HD-GYP domain, c-di-GMP phosphodiesterase class II (Or its inactivated variant) n=1 Tax=Alkalicoccus daliensis TaxID=745820 RepID=A0A1H0FMN9_9BACI|nr:HD-GYP domain-containing protein [Alkalicoccus daliensis]SDN95802.1 HD-GYP domain, c-di-GMP phosphodiesterase class II (or its inactivated variant) [Alkalicoccus daliensis]
MHVKLEELVPGCILRRDVYKLSNQPLVRKKTVLQQEHIDILHVFLVYSVHVEPKLVDGSAYKPKSLLKEEKENKIERTSLLEDNDSFTNRYLRAVQKYKKEFSKWQGRLKIEPYTMREIFLPLYEKNPTKRELMELHHFSDKKNYIYYHAVAVSIYSAMLAKKLGYSNADVIQTGLAGLLADAGMARLSFDSFNKKGSLNKDEYEEMKKHPVVSYRMLEEVPGFNKKAMLGVLQHHERQDGSGYPLGVVSGKLHPFARIITIADVFHAMTAERVYREKQSPYRVIELLQIEEYGKLDKKMVNEFIDMVLDLYPGQQVRLNNGVTAEVMEIESSNLTRPVLQTEGNEEIILKNHPQLYITEVSNGETAASV